MSVGADILLDGLERRGFSLPAAVGLLSNAERESSLDPEAEGDNGTSYGLFQWRGPRKAALFSYAQQSGRRASDPELQLDFLDHELRIDYPTLKADLNGLPAGPGSALFTHTFERPADATTKAAERAGLANRLWRNLNPVGTAEAGGLDFSGFASGARSSSLDFSSFAPQGGVPPREAGQPKLDFSSFIPKADQHGASAGWSEQPSGLDFSSFIPQQAPEPAAGLDFSSFTPAPAAAPEQQHGASAGWEDTKPMPPVPAPPPLQTSPPGVGTQIMNAIRGGLS